MQTIKETNFSFEDQKDFYRGKVRDVYVFEEHLLLLATDRISAFDTILPEAIPHKGQVLTQLSAFFMEACRDIVPSWVISYPHPNAAWGWKCEPFPVEMVIRGHLAGSAWRAYRDGQRNFNGQLLPDGFRENDPLPQAIITPTTKAAQGEHDEEITNEAILSQGLVSEDHYTELLRITQALFQRGRETVRERGFILADTKYEFGLRKGKIYLIDELHTPDSSRYFDSEGFEERQRLGERQTHRSKEMVRQWLIQNGFQGRAGEQIPAMSSEWIQAVSQEYIRLYEQITHNELEPLPAVEEEGPLEVSIKTKLFS